MKFTEWLMKRVTTLKGDSRAYNYSY